MSIIPSLAAWCSESVSRRGQLRAARLSGKGAVRIYGTRTLGVSAVGPLEAAKNPTRDLSKNLMNFSAVFSQWSQHPDWNG
jgi:hypothetical protein